ncbi:MAG: hypothetical protein SPF89_02780 [Sphaerochaetaceae bacterium]|nr:hypothetical protein [Sphaerochaetaceae bacterium]
MRRDELWITDKNRDGVSTLYSVADYKDEEGKKTRRNEAIAKNYLVGSCGGIPALKPLVMMKGGGGMARKSSERRAGKRWDRNDRFATRNPVLGYYLMVTDTEETEKNYFEGLKNSIPSEIRLRLRRQKIHWTCDGYAYGNRFHSRNHGKFRYEEFSVS